MSVCEYPVANTKGMTCGSWSWDESDLCAYHRKVKEGVTTPAPKCGCGNPLCGHQR